MQEFKNDLSTHEIIYDLGRERSEEELAVIVAKLVALHSEDDMKGELTLDDVLEDLQNNTDQGGSAVDDTTGNVNEMIMEMIPLQVSFDQKDVAKEYEWIDFHFTYLPNNPTQTFDEFSAWGPNGMPKTSSGSFRRLPRSSPRTFC